MTVTQDNQVLLTVAEVAAVLRVSKMTVYRLIHEGAFRDATGTDGAIRVGRCFRIHQWAASLVYSAGAAR